MFSTTKLLHAMVWQAETPQPLDLWGRTPIGVLFLFPKNKLLCVIQSKLSLMG